MADVPLWLTVISGIGLGGVLTAAVTFLGNRWIKSRELSNEMAKQKMNVVSQSMGTYIKLSTYYSILALLIKREKVNTSSCLFYISQIFSLQGIIFDKYGSIQLDDLEAESIVSTFGDDILEVMTETLDIYDVNILTRLGTKPHYDIFIQGLKDHPSIVPKFENWIRKSQSSHSTSFLELEKKCRWYSQLLMLELNHIYKLWYGEEPTLTQLDADLRDHLENEHPRYYSRLAHFETKSKLK